MDGFVLLDEIDDGGRAWVRQRHVTAVRIVAYREGTSTADAQHLVYALAGGRWFVDPVRHRTWALAEARASVIAGVGGTGGSVLSQVRSVWTSLVRRS